jgi:hypothetical protein
MKAFRISLSSFFIKAGRADEYDIFANMNDANLTLSPSQLSLASDPGIILAKNAVIEKVYSLFGILSGYQERDIQPIRKSLEEALDIPPKISRGESYLGLPYVILDFPRYFRPHDVLAIRTMFWWGNFFSVTLHLKGNYREIFGQRILDRYELVRELGFYAGIGTDEWEHHFGEDNYLSVDMIEEDEWQALYKARNFTKLALRFPVSDFNQMEEQLPEAYRRIIRILA